MQRMLRVERFDLQHGEQLHQHAPLGIVLHQKPQVCGEQHRARPAAGHAACAEILGVAGGVVVFAIHHRQHIVFAAHIPQHALLGDAHLVGHVLHGDAVESPLADQPDRGVKDLLAAFLRRLANTLRRLLFFAHIPRVYREGKQQAQPAP